MMVRFQKGQLGAQWDGCPRIVDDSQRDYNSRMDSAGQRSEHPRQLQDIRLVVDTIPTLAWSARPDGSADFFNQRWLDYTGLATEQALDWGWQIAVHPDDLPPM